MTTSLFLGQAFCRFPGRPEHGDTTTVAKDYYLSGEKLVFYCTRPEFKLNSENVLECLEGGQWSRAMPKCLPATGKKSRA